MNILIINDDGPDSYGLKLLQQKAKLVFREAPTITLTLDKPSMGRGSCMSCPVSDWEDYPLEERERNHYVAAGLEPMDLVVLSYNVPHRFLRKGTFDVVLSGVNLGANVGLDVLVSGTVNPCMLAASAFGWAAMAFSQALPNKLENFTLSDGKADVEFYATADRLLHETFLQYEPRPGECFSFNYPAKDVPYRNFYHTPVANFSRWWMKPSDGPPAGTDCDILKLNEGWITVSELEWRVNPTMKM